MGRIIAIANQKGGVGKNNDIDKYLQQVLLKWANVYLLLI